MFVIMVNGQAGSGKTYLCDALEAALKVASDRQIIRMGFKDPIKQALAEHVNNFVFDLKHLVNPDDADDYAAMKKLDIGSGVTGRQFMIAMGNAMRETEAFFLPAVLLTRVRHVPPQKMGGEVVEPIVLIDDLGFGPERMGMIFQSDVKALTIYVEQYAIDHADGKAYPHGMQFANDSRVSLRGDSDLIDPNLEELPELVLRWIDTGSLYPPAPVVEKGAVLAEPEAE